MIYNGVSPGLCQFRAGMWCRIAYPVDSSANAFLLIRTGNAGLQTSVFDSLRGFLGKRSTKHLINASAYSFSYATANQSQSTTDESAILRVLHTLTAVGISKTEPPTLACSNYGLPKKAPVYTSASQGSGSGKAGCGNANEPGRIAGQFRYRMIFNKSIFILLITR